MERKKYFTVTLYGASSFVWYLRPRGWNGSSREKKDWSTHTCPSACNPQRVTCEVHLKSSEFRTYLCAWHACLPFLTPVYYRRKKYFCVLFFWASEVGPLVMPHVRVKSFPWIMSGLFNVSRLEWPFLHNLKLTIIVVHTQGDVTSSRSSEILVDPLHRYQTLPHLAKCQSIRLKLLFFRGGRRSRLALWNRILVAVQNNGSLLWLLTSELLVATSEKVGFGLKNMCWSVTQSGRSTYGQKKKKHIN